MVVVDASVVFKWLVEEDVPTTQAAQDLLARFLSGVEKVIAPDVLLYELGNVFASKTKLSLKEAKSNWQEFVKFELPIFYPNLKFISKCLEFAKNYHVSVYDAAYAVLAKDKKCNLITADGNFVSQVNLPFIKHLSSLE